MDYNIVGIFSGNQAGKTWNALKAFAANEDSNANRIKAIARWIGSARRQYPVLTNEHENELYDWMLDDKNTPNSEKDFLELVDSFIPLSDNKFELLDIIDEFQPDIIHFEEIPELFYNTNYNIFKKR
jgi:hypothetical protein